MDDPFGGFSPDAVKAWRQREHDEGRPSSLNDFYRAHGLCATCTGSGKTIVGVNWSMRLEANKRSASEPKRLHQLLTSTTAIFAVWPSGSTCTKTVQYAAAQAECLRQDPRS